MNALRVLILIAVSSKVQATDDKVSLPEQERLIRKYCKEQGYQVIEPPLMIKGHSRSESDIIDLLNEYQEAQIYAYHDLRKHWKDRDFDVLIAFDSSRVGRSLTLVTWVFENVINSGAHIYLIQGGRFDDSNADMGIAMCAISATAGLKRLRKMYQAGLIGRVHRGLSMTDVPMTHMLIYDEKTGKPLRLEVREDKRQLWNDVATLVLEGVAWRALSLELFHRFGHTNPDTGKPYRSNSFYRMLHNPYTWGAAAKGYADKYGIWAFDDAAPLPEGVLIDRYPNPSVPPVYTDELAALLKDELQRRADLIQGHASPRHSYKFTGLIVCGCCGRRMAMEHKQNGHKEYSYWRCSSRSYEQVWGHSCNNRTIRDDVVRDWINAFLEALREEGGAAFSSMISQHNNEHRQTQQRVDQLNSEISSSQRKMENMINQQALQVEPEVTKTYTRLIAEVGEQIKNLTIALRETERAIVESETEQQARVRGMGELAALTLAEFWESDQRHINQVLVRIMGPYKFVALDGTITSIVRQG